MKMTYAKGSFAPSNLDNTIKLARTERNLKDVQQLRCELGSYRFEPQTYGMYMRMEYLKNGLESLKRSDQEIIAALKNRKKSAKEYEGMIRRQNATFNKLQQGIEAYIFACTEQRHI